MIKIYLSISHNNHHFSFKRLSVADKKRLLKTPLLNANKDFINSRKLIQIAKPRGRISLSHKKSNCVLAVCKKPIGIDMEELINRDFESVSSFCFNQTEKELLEKSENHILVFYQIFTLKEALLKKNDLNFSDIDKVGLKKIKDKLMLCDDLGRSSDYLSFLWRNFLISVVW